MKKRIKIWIALVEEALKTKGDLDVLFKHPGRKSRLRLWQKVQYEKHNRDLTKEEREHSRIICYVAERKMSRKRKKMTRLAKRHGMKLTMP